VGRVPSRVAKIILPGAHILARFGAFPPLDKGGEKRATKPKGACGGSSPTISVRRPLFSARVLKAVDKFGGILVSAIGGLAGVRERRGAIAFCKVGESQVEVVLDLALDSSYGSRAQRAAEVGDGVVVRAFLVRQGRSVQERGSEIGVECESPAVIARGLTGSAKRLGGAPAIEVALRRAGRQRDANPKRRMCLVEATQSVGA